MSKYNDKKTILVVDDERESLIPISKIINNLGYNTIPVISGKRAVEIIKSKKNIELVLMDCWMPDLNGIETLKLIKAENPLIPVIIMSGYGTKATEDKIFSRGADGFLQKPVNIADLKRIIVHGLKIRDEIQGRQRVAVIPEYNVSKILLVDDSAPFRNSLQKFLTMNGYAVESASNGEEAVIKAIGADYDIILMDINMPGKNGIEAIKEIKEITPLSFIVVITGEAEKEEIKQALELGSYMCLRKPLNLKQFLKSIKHFEEANRFAKKRYEFKKKFNNSNKIMKFFYHINEKFVSVSDYELQNKIMIFIMSIVFIFLLYFAVNYSISYINNMGKPDKTTSLSVFKMYDTIKGYLERDESRELNK